MTPEAAAATGWRIAFVLGGATGLLSFLLRRRLHESADYAAMRAAASRTPLRELFGATAGRCWSAPAPRPPPPSSTA